MAVSKKQHAKKQAPKKSTPKRSITKGAQTRATKRAKRAPPVSKTSTKKKATPRTAPRALPARVSTGAPKAFARNVADADRGTGVWFVVAGSVEHAAIQKRGADGTMILRTDAGATEVVPLSNLFETADEARAARYR